MQNDIQNDIQDTETSPQSNQNNSTPFLTPEEVSVHDAKTDLVIDASSNSEEPVHPLTKPINPIKKYRLKFWPHSKKQWIITSVVVIIIALVGSILAVMDTHHKSTVTYVVIHSKSVVKSNLVASTLTGLPVLPSVNQRPITAVMIENSPQARPQSGLSQAGVVFEALTEGGISRFMALFQNQTPTYVGPVRSARPYFIDWALGFDAPYAHDGGSPQALSDIQSLGVKDLDYLNYPTYFQRISSRQAPHNLYTSIPGLIKLEAQQGWTSSSFTGWARKSDSPAKNPNATNINFTLSYSTYNVNYTYDAATNSYNRSEGGAPQIGSNTGKQLSPKVVIGMIVPWSQGPLDTSNAYYSVYKDIGSGPAYVFQDGTETTGIWVKNSATGPLDFTTNSGQALKLNAGQTWITALASQSDLSYN